MARENAGHIECPMCHQEAPVRKDKNGGLYINCNTCGLLQPKLQGGQDYILEHAEWIGSKPERRTVSRGALADPAPAPKLERKGPAQPKTDPAPEPEPAAAPIKKPSMLDDFL